MLTMRPQSARFIAGQRATDRVKRRRQVDGEDRVPLVGRKRFDVGNVLDAGVVDEDVDSTELGLGVGDHRFDLRRVAHVGGIVIRAYTPAAQLGLELRDLVTRRRIR